MNSTLADLGRELANFSLPKLGLSSNARPMVLALKEASNALNRALANFSLNERPRFSAAFAFREVTQAMEGFRHELSVQRRSIELRGLNRALDNFSLSDAGTSPLIEVKRSPSAAEIAGYGAVFGNVDDDGEVFDSGAFSQSLAEHSKAHRQPPMLWAHDQSNPIGFWTQITEDGKGLLAKGKLLATVQRGAEALALIDAGAIDGLSVGFRTKRDQIINKTRHIQVAQLMEISLVCLPSNSSARLIIPGKEYR
jgi:HK97 family phage prohead protease